MSTTDQHNERDDLAELAVADIRNNAIVALGTGRAASRVVRALARRTEREGLTVKGVPTSDATQHLAEQLGIPILPLKDAMHIDELLDGADEVDPELRMIKGAGGAMTREKIAAHAANHRTYLINETKLVERLGQRVRLPVEVIEPALAMLTVRLEYLDLDPQLRMRHDAAADTQDPYLTDNRNFVIDIAVPQDRPPKDLDVMLRLLPGVVGHGLFLTEADRVIVESPDAPPRVLTRERDADRTTPNPRPAR